MNEKRIVGINTNYPIEITDKLPFFTQINFNETTSLYDYDAVLINSFIHFSGTIAQRYSLQQGLCINHEIAYQYAIIFTNLRKQLKDLLIQGKNIYVIVNQNDEYYYKYNYRRHDFNILGYLPQTITYEVLKGKEFNIERTEPYFSFFSSLRDILSYKNVIQCDSIKKILTIKNTEKCIGGVFNYENGKIIFIPALKELSLQDQILKTINKEEYDEDSHEIILLHAIQDLENKLSAELEDALPEWTNDFDILNEAELKNEISEIENEISTLKQKLENKTQSLSCVQEYKYLLTTSGKTLEKIVTRVLKEIGFTLFETEENRTDVIAKYKNRDVVFEIKGVKHSAAEKNAAQLEKWVSEFISVNNKIPKAVLIVNGYYEVPITERNEPIFPNQMLKFSKDREHCLLSTYQLLKLFIEIKQHPEKSEDLIKELLNTVGIYDKYK